MTKSGRLRREARQRAHGDEGAALIEFALVAILLFTLVFGIIQFGLILSFKQDVTRAAAEGARAGAVAVATDGDHATAAKNAAVEAMSEAIDGIGGDFNGQTCSPGVVAQAGTADLDEELVCEVSVNPCAEDPGKDCVTVTLRYPYKKNPLFGDIPLISAFFPDSVNAKSVARIND